MDDGFSAERLDPFVELAYLRIALMAPIGRTDWAILIFLALVIMLMAFTDQADKIAFWCLPGVAVVLTIGWRAVRRRPCVDHAGGKLLHDHAR